MCRVQLKDTFCCVSKKAIAHEHTGVAKIYSAALDAGVSTCTRRFRVMIFGTRNSLTLSFAFLPRFSPPQPPRQGLTVLP